MSYFPNVEKVQYEGTQTTNPYAFRHYNPEEVVEGKPCVNICALLWLTGIP